MAGARSEARIDEDLIPAGLDWLTATEAELARIKARVERGRAPLAGADKIGLAAGAHTAGAEPGATSTGGPRFGPPGSACGRPKYCIA